MRTYEGLAVAYFAGLALASPTVAVPWARRTSVMLVALSMAGIVIGAAAYAGDAARAWLPHLYLVAGYWLPGLLAVAAVHPTGFERWLQRTDGVLRSDARVLPAALVHVIELAYLVCYPLVPVGFAIVWIAGSPADVNRFWLAVLLAGYACYVSLPWLVSRPPRLALAPVASAAGDAAHSPKAVAAVNVFVLGRVSHQLNTFPSGHVAVSLAAAAAVAPVSSVAGGLVLLIAGAIALGAVAGRYHYVIDVLLGVVAAGAAAAVAFI